MCQSLDQSSNRLLKVKNILDKIVAKYHSFDLTNTSTVEKTAITCSGATPVNLVLSKSLERVLLPK